MRKFIQEFKKFITKGNVLDLAVAVIIGNAFNKIVSSLVKDIITPCISLITGQNDFSSLAIVFTKDAEGNPLLSLNYGLFLQAIIDFLIIALTIFIALKIVNRVKNTVDINANMARIIQKKLDKDEKLSDLEAKWLKRFSKRHPDEAPRKKVEEPASQPAEPVPTETEKLLAEILQELKKNKNDNKTV